MAVLWDMHIFARQNNKNNKTMKKIRYFVLVVTAMMAAGSMKAQNGYDDTRHEVAVTYGWASNSQIIDIFEDLGGAMAGAKFKNEKFIGSISAEYFYHVKNWLGVGGIFSFGKNKMDTYLSGDKEGITKNTYVTLMPAVKFDWLRKKNFGMYSKLAVGATLRHEKFVSDTDASKNRSESKVHINWQAAFLGFEGGSPTLRGFSEFGFGEQGIFLIGLRYKF